MRSERSLRCKDLFCLHGDLFGIIGDFQLQQLALTYLTNRNDFYSVLLPRLFPEEIRKRLAEAVRPIEPDSAVWDAVNNLKATESTDDLKNILRLRDVFKKHTFGTISGGTVISVGEALKRAQEIEENGLLLFEQISRLVSDPFIRVVARQRYILGRLAELEDALRYHRWQGTSD
jgi:hypothetical protein